MKSKLIYLGKTPKNNLTPLRTICEYKWCPHSIHVSYRWQGHLLGLCHLYNVLYQGVHFLYRVVIYERVFVPVQLAGGVTTNISPHLRLVTMSLCQRADVNPITVLCTLLILCLCTIYLGVCQQFLSGSFEGKFLVMSILQVNK